MRLGKGIGFIWVKKPQDKAIEQKVAMRTFYEIDQDHCHPIQCRFFGLPLSEFARSGTLVEDANASDRLCFGEI